MRARLANVTHRPSQPGYEPAPSMSWARHPNTASAPSDSAPPATRPLRPDGSDHDQRRTPSASKAPASSWYARVWVP